MTFCSNFCCFDIWKSLLAWPLLYSITKQSQSQIFIVKWRYLPIKWLPWWAQSEAFMLVNSLDFIYTYLPISPSSDPHMGAGPKPTSVTYEWSYGLGTHFSVTHGNHVLPNHLAIYVHKYTGSQVRPHSHTQIVTLQNQNGMTFFQTGEI